MKLCMPLFSGTKLIGFLALGAKEKNEPYSREEIEVLLKLQKHLGICLMNILIKKNMQEEHDLMKKMVDEKTEALSEQIRKVKLLTQQQSDFIAIIAHEFRTPLTTAMLTTEQAIMENPEMETKLKTVDSAIQRLHQLSEKFFTVQKYDLGKIKSVFSYLNVLHFFQDIHNTYMPLIKNKKINFQFEHNVPQNLKVIFDPSQLRQLIENILNNAIRFTPENGIIELNVKTQKNEIVFSVSDSGPGIAAIDKRHVFKKFRDGAKMEGKGIGLGLYICKKIIEVHNGTISVGNSSLGGAKFIVRFPQKGLDPS